MEKLFGDDYSEYAEKSHYPFYYEGHLERVEEQIYLFAEGAKNTSEQELSPR